ncbi:hypothetical protein [Breznakia pachnodae]|uniref:Uncharacterized protein n=1 Tax=Breznakia pachnodae TaxID=265178 RepID=A0ABU0E3Y8_9FIRM|nr:hypothetical protein [Breznakia pachnodae]MDQ0361600.1 hypothetical protein [Breznakia pachnodae]
MLKSKNDNRYLDIRTVQGLEHILNIHTLCGVEVKMNFIVIILMNDQGEEKEVRILPGNFNILYKENDDEILTINNKTLYFNKTIKDQIEFVKDHQSEKTQSHSADEKKAKSVAKIFAALFSILISIIVIIMILSQMVELDNEVIQIILVFVLILLVSITVIIGVGIWLWWFNKKMGQFGLFITEFAKAKRRKLKNKEDNNETDSEEVME